MTIKFYPSRLPGEPLETHEHGVLTLHEWMSRNVPSYSQDKTHPVVIEPPAGITLDVPAPNRIVISGINKESVGAIAANIRSLREPEPYKGKGIKYEGEYVRRKVGKAGGKGKK